MLLNVTYMQRTFSINIMISNLEINLFFFLKCKCTSNKVKIEVKFIELLSNINRKL